MAQPSVTFIIPCFNYGRFVADAVESALAQREADVRVIIIDDGSTDGTSPAACDRLAGDRVKVIHQANGGPGSARNRGAREAGTELVVFLDADDTVDPQFVRKLWEAMQAQELAGRGPVSHGYCQEVLTEQASGTWRVPEWDPLLLMMTNLHPVTTLLRKSCFDQVGGFEESLGGNYEDWDLWLKLSFKGYVGARVAEPLFFWRRHSQDTMVMRAVLRHDETFARIMERHRTHYEQRGLELVRLANGMLRRFDCNWIDETGIPIPLQYLRAIPSRLAELEARTSALMRQDELMRQQVDYVRARNDVLSAELLAHAAASLETERAIREHYESYAVIRAHRAWHRLLEALPRPVAWLPRQAARALRLLGR